MLELMLNTISELSPPGEYILRQTAGDQTVPWIVPDGVTSICAVVVGNGANGGGGLSYRNDIPVTPGETLTLQFVSNSAGGTSGLGCRVARGTTRLCVAFSGGRSTVSNGNRPGGSGGKTAFASNDGGGDGGVGIYTATPSQQIGGGAGGYAGNGGAASNVNNVGSTAGAANSGSGSGARAYSPATGSYAGGHVGLHGIGATAESVPLNTVAAGNNGSTSSVMCGGGFFTTSNVFNGGIRIIWGAGRSFPNNAA